MAPGGPLMYCGDRSVERLTGVDFYQVRKWIGAYRESQGRRANVNVGGTHLHELKHALARAGYTLTECSGGRRRMRLRDWARQHRSGRWLIGQHRHWFALRGSKQIRAAAKRSPNAVLVQWWRVDRASTPEQPSEGPR